MNSLRDRLGWTICPPITYLVTVIFVFNSFGQERPDPYGIKGFLLAAASLHALPAILVTTPVAALLGAGATILVVATVTIGYLAALGWYAAHKPTLKERILWFVIIDLAFIAVPIILLHLFHPYGMRTNLINRFV